MHYRHVPVMVEEVVHHLDCVPGKSCLDGTLGGGGHAKAILQHIDPGGFFLGIDKDPDAVAWARHTLRGFTSRIHFFNDDFANAPRLLSETGQTKVHGVLLDLGLSLYQIEGSGRGFSFKRDEPLDMRMNPRQALTAGQIVNRFREDRLAGIIAQYGEEPWAGRIARAIVKARAETPIRSSSGLAAVVSAAIPAKHRPRRIHPATRTFQALRITVNDELGSLRDFLIQAPEMLKPYGRLCIISFHSLEDRIVKQAFRHMANPCQCPPDFPVCTCGEKATVRILTKRPVRPDNTAIAANPLARSAKLRAVEKLPEGKS